MDLLSSTAGTFLSTIRDVLPIVTVIFAFQVLPTIIFFASLMGVLLIPNASAIRISMILLPGAISPLMMASLSRSKT